MTGPRPVLFDTDVGGDVDDALALGLILASPSALELKAVTTVGGESRLRARVAAGLLRLAGRRGVDVCAGEERPLLRPRERFGWFGHESECVVEGAPAVSTEPAPERIVRAAREIPGLELIAVGPLTNLARALALDPELPGRVAGLTVMGGHVREVRIGQFLCAPGIDYNLCSDPEASVAVLGAGFRTTLVTADVTLSTWLTMADVEKLAKAGPLARELARQVRIWEPVQRKLFTGMGGTVAPDNAAFLHDPLTVLALIDASSLRFESLRIATTIERGVLRTHELPLAAALGSQMRVATKVDPARAARAIVDRIASA
ncbi:MAG TPA: nucleoside hydrolase [Myxococcota bacterium]